MTTVMEPQGLHYLLLAIYNISISNKCWTILKNLSSTIVLTFILIRNGSSAANQPVMISEGSYDTEDWSNDENPASISHIIQLDIQFMEYTILYNI